MADSNLNLKSIIKDLSSEEIQIYELGLLRGYVTASMVNQLNLKINPKKIEECFKKLAQNKLLKKLPGIVPRYIPLTPIKDYLNYLEKFETEKNATLQQLDKLRNEQDKVSKSVHENTDKIISSSFTDIRTKIETLKTQTVQDIEEQIKDSNSGFQDLTQSTDTKIEESINTSFNSFDKESSAKLDEFIQKTKDSQNSYAEKNDAILKSYDEKTTLHKIELDRFFTKQQETIDESLTKTKSLVSEQAERMDDKMEKISVEAQQVLKENVENSAETIAQAIRNAEEISKNTLDSVVKNTGMMLTNSTSEVKKTFDNTYSEVQNTGDQLINALGAQQNELKEKIRAQITDLMSTTTNQMTKVESDLLVKSDALVQDSISEFQTSHKNWESSISDVLTNIIDSVNQGSTDLKSVISKSIQDEITKFKGEITAELTKIQNQYVARVEKTGKTYETAFKNNINDKLVDFQNNLKKNLDQLKKDNSEFTKNQTSVYTDFNNTIKTTISDTGSTINKDFRSILQTSYEEALKTISNIYTENSGQAENSINSTLDILKQNSKLLLLDIDEITKLIDEGLKNESSKLLITVDERVNKIRELAQQTINNQDTIIAENMKKNKQILEILAQNANFSLDKASEAMKNTINQFQMGLNPNIKAILDESKSTFSATKDDLVNLIENIRQYYSETTNILQESYKTAMKESKTDLQDHIQEHNKKMSEMILSAQQKIENAFQQAAESSNKIVTELENSIQKTGMEVQKEVFSKLTQLSTQVENNVTSAATTLDVPKRMFSDIWKNFIDSKLFESEKTWIISGQDMVMEHVRNMIQRAKASVFLLVPKFDDLDWNEIMDIHKKGRKFIICTNLETVKDINLVNRAFESGIELFSYTEKDFIAAYHDNEEILIAPISPKEDETTAIVSEISPMVQHMSSMFADYWRRSAKKYQPK
jgi:hypothetical protein